MEVGRLEKENGSFLSYERSVIKNAPGLVYFHGLQSNKQSKKAAFLKQYTADRNISYLGFDFSSHGESSGKPEDFTIGQAFDDAKLVLEKLAEGPQVIVGSSMGGWIGLLAAKYCAPYVRAFVGMAAAPDFTTGVWEHMLNEQAREFLIKGGVLGPSTETKGYCFTYRFFEEAKKHFMLDQKIAYDGPAVLMVGDKDSLVPIKLQTKIKDQLTSGDVSVMIIKDATHALNRDEDFQKLENVLDGIMGGKNAF